MESSTNSRRITKPFLIISQEDCVKRDAKNEERLSPDNSTTNLHLTTPRQSSASREIPSSQADTLPRSSRILEAQSPEWSSAVGRAATGGKSGRVIERLMNDNDVLRREKKLAIARLEEEIKRGESARAALEVLQHSNANLSSVHEADISLLAKRDRRINQLRDDLESERSRRVRADLETLQTKKERELAIEQVQKQGLLDRQKFQRANSQYEALSICWKSHENDFRKQVDILKSQLNKLQQSWGDDKKTIDEMHALIEQSTNAIKSQDLINQNLQQKLEDLQSEFHACLSQFRAKFDDTMRRDDAIHAENVRTLHGLKWSLNLANLSR